MPSSVSLRDEHAAAARVRILSAVAELIERGQPEELTMPDVATASGISLRTIYRYFPTRDDLLEAVGHWIGEDVLQSPFPRALDEIAPIFQKVTPRFDERPGLVRAMAVSGMGR